jgi:uncharacterized protein (TIGR02118 family)
MPKLLVLYPQPIDVAAFDRHYDEVHIPLSKRLPGLKRYAVSRNQMVVRGDDPYYLVAELDWDDMDSMQADFQSPLGQEVGQDVAENLEKLCPGMQSMIIQLEDV